MYIYIYIYTYINIYIYIYTYIYIYVALVINLLTLLLGSIYLIFTCFTYLQLQNVILNFSNCNVT